MGSFAENTQRYEIARGKWIQFHTKKPNQDIKLFVERADLSYQLVPILKEKPDSKSEPEAACSFETLPRPYRFERGSDGKIVAFVIARNDPDGTISVKFTMLPHECKGIAHMLGKNAELARHWLLKMQPVNSATVETVEIQVFAEIKKPDRLLKRRITTPCRDMKSDELDDLEKKIKTCPALCEEVRKAMMPLFALQRKISAANTLLVLSEPVGEITEANK